MASFLEEMFKQAVRPGPQRLLTGVALAAAGAGSNDNDVDYLNAFGTLSLDPSSPPVSCDTVMWLASCSKLVTTVAALQCVERGLFKLHDRADVRRLLPEWINAEILTGLQDGKPLLQPAKGNFTLAQLLTHTSGLAYDFLPPLSEWRASRNEGSFAMSGGRIPEIFSHPLLFEPGTGYSYGASMDLVGLMVARANACSLEEYMQKNIFSILGMKSMSFHPMVHGDMAERMMSMTTRLVHDGDLIQGHNPNGRIGPFPLDPQDDSGGAGLFGTAADFLVLLKSLLRNDGQLLKPASVDTIFEPAISPACSAALKQVLTIPPFAAFMTPGEPVGGTPGAGEWSQGVAGLIGLTDQENGLQAPWLQWGGAPCLKWWIDRNTGTCGIFATQLYPTGEEQHQFLVKRFQQEMVSRYRTK
ncbi:beta-lactamase/transpeptidase-like protein [Amniculicola lignicola CBS 123094]|uniref:Beta-lactamase/transpeptidase-like protein n=1 Tax=Amniculicola lignicola CBS 123094 TaxID=1392246 RepID=A0A6A5X5C4_9PLEO|nr:beta-lactamase/transpeptidase-like protein [Amniculicola lignicola CBS 123094]